MIQSESRTPSCITSTTLELTLWLWTGAAYRGDLMAS